MTETLKYENVAKVGDRIRSYDFHGVANRFIEGRVVEIDLKCLKNPYASFVVLVDKDNCPCDDTVGRVGLTVYVPMECALLEYDGRIVNLGPAAPPG